ncbi:MAG: bis-aminopropyl spermidine synthase family protein [Microthrixaceae bacterium]
MSTEPPSDQPENGTSTDAAATTGAPAGLATVALRPAIRRLVEGPATVGELVACSGVSRRGIEALLATLGTNPEATLVEQGERWAVSEALRNQLIAAWDLASPPPAGRFLEPAVGGQLARWAESLGRPRRELDHRPATPDGVAARLDAIDSHLDVRGANVLVLGGRDLDALVLAADGRARQVAVLDVDDATLAVLGAADTGPGQLLTRWCDVRLGLPSPWAGWADLVLTDPPYTPEGMAAFLAIARQALSGPESRIAVSYGYGETRATLGWQVQREMIRAGLALTALWPGAVTYVGAEAIGGRADLYLLAPTGRDPVHHEAANRLYTQGSAAARSASEPDPAPLDAAIALAGSLAPEGGEAQVIGVRRLLSPGGAPKLRSGAVPVVDLRDDPGGWLPRLLLALPCPSAVLVVDLERSDRRPGADPAAVDGRAWVRHHLAAHWTLDPANAPGAGIGAGDEANSVGAEVLVARRVETAGAPAAAPMLVGRGHANPRNVLAEWLTAQPGDPSPGGDGAATPPTRRQARALAEAHLAQLRVAPQPGDALIDLPLDRLAALLASPIPQSGATLNPGG